jgi:hypothetical protein
MPTQTQCSHCDPPGSGRCRDCQSASTGGNAKCSMCYGSGFCRYCNGMGLAMSALDRCKQLLRSVWWISWFGIIFSFFLVAFWEHRYISSQGGISSRFSVALLIVTSLLWVLFFATEEKARDWVEGAKSKIVVAELLTLAGTILAIFTLLGIFYFIYVAPRIQ